MIEADRVVRELPPASGRSARAPAARPRWSIRPSIERHDQAPPSRRMFSATPMASSGSSHSQPVTGTSEQADDDAGRGPDVGEQVARVGLERDRAVLARLRQHAPGQHAVEHRADHRQRQAPAQRSAAAAASTKRCTAAQMMASAAPRSAGPRSRWRNTRPCGGRRDGRRRPGARRRSPSQREHRAGQVDERLHRVGQQADRIGDPPGQRLQHDGGHARPPPTASGRRLDLHGACAPLSAVVACACSSCAEELRAGQCAAVGEADQVGLAAGARARCRSGR